MPNTFKIPTVTRKDIRTLSVLERDNLVKAFDGIQKLPPSHPNSFFTIAGYHGQPFRGAGYGNPQWWGGYCNHGNILFPTWHRAYLFRLEKALQSQVPGVAIPYWNEVDDETTTGSGIPDIFLTEKYTFADRSSIDNPLRSYTFQKTIKDRLSPFPDADYSRPANVKTCRFPFSGLYSDADKVKTEDHNKEMEAKGIDETNGMLNKNVRDWLTASEYITSKGNVIAAGVKNKYEKCLDAPTYTVFSNTTSAGRWNDDHSDVKGFVPIVPLESPHNSMHLAIGGIQIPSQDVSSVPDANGDMAENDTASFDPIFFFHHAFIDMMFYRWQVRYRQTTELQIEHEFTHYPGTNSVDAQGPTPGVPGNKWLTLDHPLDPFMNPLNNSLPLTSKDVVDIKKLHYVYDIPPVGEPMRGILPGKPAPKSPHLSVHGINRAGISGSFVVSAWAMPPDGDAQLVGTEAVLSRWHVSGCGNCQTHLEVPVHFALDGWSTDYAKKTDFKVLVHTRDKPHGKKPSNLYLGIRSEPEESHGSNAVRFEIHE